MMKFRTFLFQAAYWITSIFFGLMALPLLLIPGRKILMGWLFIYTKVMTFWMRVIAGIQIKIIGRDHVPAAPCIIAAKHQSWGDGFTMFSQFYDLTFVVGDHLEKLPLVGHILRKMGTIIVDNNGGYYARSKLVSEQLKKNTNMRRVLIYPE